MARRRHAARDTDIRMRGEREMTQPSFNITPVDTDFKAPPIGLFGRDVGGFGAYGKGRRTGKGYGKMTGKGMMMGKGKGLGQEVGPPPGTRGRGAIMRGHIPAPPPAPPGQVKPAPQPSSGGRTHKRPPGMQPGTKPRGGGGAAGTAGGRRRTGKGTRRR